MAIAIKVTIISVVRVCIVAWDLLIHDKEGPLGLRFHMETESHNLMEINIENIFIKITKFLEWN